MIGRSDVETLHAAVHRHPRNAEAASDLTDVPAMLLQQRKQLPGFAIATLDTRCWHQARGRDQLQVVDINDAIAVSVVVSVENHLAEGPIRLRSGGRGGRFGLGDRNQGGGQQKSRE